MKKMFAKSPLRRAPIFTPYVIVWATLGMLGLGYLSIVTMAPDWLEGLSAGANEANGSPRATGSLVSDVAALRDSVQRAQVDIAKLKTDAFNQAEATKQLRTQVSALEGRAAAPIEIPTASAPQAAAPQAGTLQAAAAPPVVETTAIIAKTTAAPGNLATAQPKLINAPATAPAAAAPLVTGSVNPPAASGDAISFGPAVVKPAPKPLGVVLSSGESVDSLRLSWSLLSDNYGGMLKNLEPRYTGGDAANPNYNLVAGPVKTKAEAQKICKALAAASVPCRLSDFSGNAL